MARPVESSPVTAPPVAVYPARPGIPSQRLVSLDVFRGATILGMILVNNGAGPGTFAPLRHAHWHGWTPTDLVFPFFLFIVGVAVTLSYTKRLASGVDRAHLVRKAVIRSIVIFGIGLFLNAFPFVTLMPEPGWNTSVTNLRIMGVLQRIALCYLVVSLMYLYLKPRAIAWWTAGLLFGYWALMTLVPVPGYGVGLLDDREGNLAAFIDRLVFGSHLYSGANYRFDPEGLLSTLPAICTALFGVWTGRKLAEDTEPARKTVALLAAGLGLVTAGYVWNGVFPINKALWTSSYTVFTAGLALCGFALCYWFVDVNSRRKVATFFVIPGMNAIAVYVLSGVVADLMGLIPVTGSDGSPVSLHTYLFESFYLALAPPAMASLLNALTMVALMYLAALVLYWKKIFLKV